MKYLIILAIMSIVGTVSIVQSNVEKKPKPAKSIPVEYHDFETTPIYIVANAR